MIYIDIEQAQSSIAKLLKVVAKDGEVVIITEHSVPVARLQPLQQLNSKRKFGSLKGLFSIGPEFFDSLPPEELEAWEE